ncbi:Acetylglucosamine-6-sulfatase [uncultured Defluviicoccus sp.]|uniref:Acetylglucosamine-6-sulfatase n=1 Tax=metagenome TaxID=256318 RepID=A0A380TE51_9ZZZZ|nr:Acetylglucosamine-6-sulfatase [uncultured Defluviicoccus sp.]
MNTNTPDLRSGRRHLHLLVGLLGAWLWLSGPAAAAPRNVIFILADDHRYDALGFMGHPFVETPNLDSLAKNGVHLRNAFVTTSLCSPSRASILTGLYAHHHGVVDNRNPVRPDLVFFPQLLQKTGYRTGFFGKWHMGGAGDDPRPGFDRWVSFAGQGEYWPDRRGTKSAGMGPPAILNVDGRQVPQKGYITDELTDYALDWLHTLPPDQPYFLYLSHKAVHSEFVPADRHAGRYKDKSIPVPVSENHHEHAPMWVQNQRNSWHGVDFPYHSDLNVADYERRYCETLLALDESVGRVLAALRERRQLENTIVIYMGDNGFAFGEHGLIDKRTAYEWSMRVPLLMQCPAVLKAGTVVGQMVANIDIAPTILDIAGVQSPTGGKFDGASFWPLVRGEQVPWRTELLYEYYWEHNFPQTPTIFALRGERFKFSRAYGIWDSDELYDFVNDPNETRNLIYDPAYRQTAETMRQKLFAELEATGGLDIPMKPDLGEANNFRREGGSPAAQFPQELMRKNSNRE